MSFWQLKDYFPEPGVSPVREWYDDQDDEVCAEMDYALHAQTRERDWEESLQVRVLQEPFRGLLEICVDMEIDDEAREFRVIGSFVHDSPNIVLFQISERRGDIYDPPLEEAMAYKLAFEKGKRGEIHEHRFL